MRDNKGTHLLHGVVYLSWDLLSNVAEQDRSSYVRCRNRERAHIAAVGALRRVVLCGARKPVTQGACLTGNGWRTIDLRNAVLACPEIWIEDHKGSACGSAMIC